MIMETNGGNGSELYINISIYQNINDESKVESDDVRGKQPRNIAAPHQDKRIK